MRRSGKHLRGKCSGTPEILSPGPASGREVLSQTIQSFQEKSRLENRKELPENVDGINLNWKEKKSSSVAVIPILTVISLILGIYGEGSGA